MISLERGWQCWSANWAGLRHASFEKACVFSKQVICAERSEESLVSAGSARGCPIWAPTRNTCGTSGGETSPPRYRRESCYLLRNLPGAPEAVIENVVAGIFQLPFQLSLEASGVKQVLRKYRDRRIDLADACLICLADEFETADILTLDKDFQIYRWSKNKPFRILVALK